MTAADQTSAWQAWLDSAGKPFDPLQHAAAAYEAFANTVLGATGDGAGLDPESLLAALRAAGAGASAPVQPPDPAAWLRPWLAWARALLQFGTLANPRDGAAPAVAWLAELLTVPPLGPQRETLQTLQELARAVLALERAQATLGKHHERSFAAALERFGAALDDDAGAPVTSLAALYDLWIETCESTYRAVVLGAEYRRDYAAFADATSVFLAALKKLQTDLGAAFGWVSGSDIETVGERLAALTRDVATLKAGQDNVRTEPVPAVTPAVLATTAPRGGATKKAAPASRQRKKKAAGRAVTSRKTPSPTRKKPAGKRRKTAPEFDIAEILGTGD